MKIITAAVLTLALFGTAHGADLKIGVVDLGKVFTEYHKTKEAQAQLEENRQKARTEMEERFALLKKIADELQKLNQETKDPVLAVEARNKKVAELQSKVQEGRALEKEIGEARETREKQLQNEAIQSRRGIQADIMKVVEEKSASGTYDFVFDRSAMSAGGAPFLLHLKEGAAADITADVIVELNKNAPAPSEASPAKK